MKILFVVEHYHPYVGGAEKLFKSLAEELVRQNHEVSVLTTSFRKGLKEVDSVNGVQIIRIKSLNRFFFTLLAIPRAIALAKKHDIIQTSSYNAAFPAFIAALFSHKKALIIFHEVWGRLWFRLPFLNPIQRLGFYVYEKLILLLPFHKYIAVSNYTRKSLLNENIPDSKIEMIYNGWDELQSLDTPVKESTFTIGFFGRLGVSKGLDLLIPAARDFSKIQPDFKLKLILPDHPKALRKKLMQFIHNQGASASIQIKEHLPFDELKTEIQACHAVVIPSYTEGFCFSAVEAVSWGMPVISSGCGALAETVSGKRIEMTEQSVPALVEAMRKAYSNQFESVPIRHFPLTESVQNYIRLYNSCLS